MSREATILDDKPLADVEIGAVARAERLRFKRKPRNAKPPSRPALTATLTRRPSGRTAHEVEPGK